MDTLGLQGKERLSQVKQSHSPKKKRPQTAKQKKKRDEEEEEDLMPYGTLIEQKKT